MQRTVEPSADFYRYGLIIMFGYISLTIAVLNIIILIGVGFYFIGIIDTISTGFLNWVGNFFIGIGVVALIILVLSVIGLIFGILSLIVKGEKKIFGIIGVILNSVPIIIFIVAQFF